MDRNLKRAEDELKELDRKTRKMLTMPGTHHTHADTDQLYINIANERRGFDKCGKLLIYRIWELLEIPIPK